MRSKTCTANTIRHSSTIRNGAIGLEVLSTLASVALWLAAEILLVTNRDVRIAIHNLHQLRDVSIEFEKDN